MKNSLPGLMRQAGRLCAVSLAYQTQPFGDDDKAEALGKVATARDIYKVYSTPGVAYSDISNPNAQRAFWSFVNRSLWDKAQKILSSAGRAFKFTPIQPFDGGTAHKQLRNARGRIAGAQKPVMIVRDPARLKIYVAQEVDHVGEGKAGWASCARTLGGIRGIPHWVARHKSPGSVVENYGADRTTITMINQVTYASEILSPSQKSEAIRISIDRLFRSIVTAERHAARLERAPIPSEA